MRTIVALAVIMGLVFIGVTACKSDNQDGYKAPAVQQDGKLVKKPKIGGPGKPVIGKPKNK